MTRPRHERSSTLNLDLFRPLVSFVRHETFGSVLLILASAVALIWANSAARDGYVRLWETPIAVAVGPWEIRESLLHWINDLAMAFFFLLVGMEIKRELVSGELDTPSKALLPVLAAVGGMLIPAALYLAVASGGEAAPGWGIPMATDIAFALGVLRLLGKRVPIGLFAFLAGLAIIDDLGAILVIAIFYSSTISWPALGAAAAFTLVLAAFNAAGVRRPGLYVLVGLPLWLALFASGIHATIAGVIVGFCLPARGSSRREELLDDAERLVAIARKEGPGDDDEAAVAALRAMAARLDSPLQVLEHAINPYVSYFVIPLFALANAGVTLVGASPALLLEHAALGVILGLVVGKPIGIVGATWLALRLRITRLPTGVTRRHLVGAGLLGGIGFTMSLFVAGLAFQEGSPIHTQAKVGILTASIIAGAIGYLTLRTTKVQAAAEGEGRREAPHAA
ncbi:MAG TPA: Na+/H+ antiporter NhaA [Vulgatibacter sp.]|nr:Na+/H+ antiporter NhaA [Vulgatibacter sp.]